MRKVRNPEEVVNANILKPGSRIYVSGNAGTSQRLLTVLAADENIQEVEVMGLLLLGDIDSLFSEVTCRQIAHRLIFNGPALREAINQGRAKYQLLHLSDISRQLRRYLIPDVATNCYICQVYHRYIMLRLGMNVTKASSAICYETQPL